MEFTPKRAVIIDDTAVIADLHLGLEYMLGEIPRVQIVEIVDSVRRLLDTYSVERLVIAGDMKHEFSRNLPYEWKDVKVFLNALKDVDVVVVRGNHDNYLKAILAEYEIELVDSYHIHGWTIVHGHKECNAKRIIMGHEHPIVRIRVGGVDYRYPCFLKIRNRTIVLPAFSPLVPGTDILTRDRFLSPILADIGDDEIEVYAIGDEVIPLGRLSLLKLVVERNFRQNL